jgi:PilX N-terminal
MKNPKPCSNRDGSGRPKKESGVALVIAIIGLLLLTAVAAGMVLMSNGEVNIDSNYRDQQVALFAAKAGLQEARDRMLAGALTLPTTQLPGSAGSTVYITASGITPWTSGSTSKGPNPVSVYDCEYLGTGSGSCPSAGELSSAGLTAATGWYTNYASSSTYSGPASNPLPYQWVRINLKVDASTSYSVDGTSANKGKQVFYDWTSLHECVTGTGSCLTSSNLQPVYEITSFAATPNGGRRMAQDEVVPASFNISLPAALTFDGPAPVYSAPSSNPFTVNGNDRSGSRPGTCSLPAQSGKPAIGDIQNSDTTTLTNDIPSNRRDGSHYTGCVGGTCDTTKSQPPAVGNVASSLNSNEQTPASLDALVQTISQNATYVLNGNQSSLPTADWGTAASPVVTVVNGNLSDSGNNTGYGILVVTGTLTLGGTEGWNGIVMVVGQGSFSYNGGGNNEFDGSVFVAKTKDASGNELATLGSPSVNWGGGGGDGIYYDSCWINNVQKAYTYQTISAKEISY